eukprot:gnl/TRDRNA2_/TRDRNA2_27707_c0_seq1.p1 gnl/TRDRNA2_/TRDRNA2_27707_c0~~gnl/TRDRNA2_/TRDRNA2_27707_c0_seq1.p1  ORF type:complete len:259 (+),score=39.88 gnl/TRDRNA2_/TRDRNA2_27707_c0_seq1:77-853(+)
MVRILGLYGPIASGKSAVADRLAAEGCPVIDADKIAHTLLSDKGGKIHRQVVAAFGEGVLDEDGVIDRQKVGAIVWNDYTKLKALNRITHYPILLAIIEQGIRCMLQGHRQIAVDVPLLVKWPKMRWLFISSLIVVVTPPETQLSRLMARNNLSEEDARRKIDAQESAEVQKRTADIVITNDGSLHDLHDKVRSVLASQPSGWTACEVILAMTFATASIAGCCFAIPKVTLLLGVTKVGTKVGKLALHRFHAGGKSAA